MSGSEEALSVIIDEIGAVASIAVDPSVYSKVAIFKAAYWFTDKFYLFLSRSEAGDRIFVEIRAKGPPHSSGLDLACRDFCNSLIDYEVRQAVITETGAIRDSLVRKAFFEGSKHLDPALVGSNESKVPQTNQSYRDDPLQIGRVTGSE